MYYNDHHPPHFHAKYGDSEAKIDIENGEVIDGKLSKRALHLVRVWHQLHQQELMEDWKLAELRAPLKKIEPLE